MPLNDLIPPIAFDCLTPKMAKDLMKRYSALVNSQLNASPNTFVEDVASRLNVERYLSGEFRKNPGVNHSPETFLRWVEKETHYAVERQGYLWDKEARKFRKPSGEELTPDKYINIKEGVLDAIVLCAIDFFYMKKGENGGNLRCSLENWMYFFI